MMADNKNLQKEADFHNKRVLEEIETGGRLSYVYASMANAISMPRNLLPIDAKKILEIGSYLGDNSIGIDSDSEYIGIDISNEAVRWANNKYASDNVNFICMDAHKVESIGNDFDYVYGNGILHHLDLDVFIPTLLNILNNQGKAVFMEPNLGPPWLRAFRALTPSIRTEDEHPLTKHDYDKFRKYFNLEIYNFGILCPLLPMLLLNNKFIINICQKADNFLAKTFLSHWSWTSVLVLSCKNKT